MYIISVYVDANVADDLDSPPFLKNKTKIL